MTDQSSGTFRTDFKRFFIRGLAILLPSVLTLWILVKAYQFIDVTIAQPINTGLRALLTELAIRWPSFQAVLIPDPTVIDQALAQRVADGEPLTKFATIQREVVGNEINTWWTLWAPYLDWIGILVAVIIVYVAGRVLGGFLGRGIYRRLESLIVTVPLFKQIYPAVKRVVDFLFSEDKQISFNRVVVVEYPRKGIWSVGLVTGATMRSIRNQSGEAITVFIPSSPTPFTGYTITIPVAEAQELPISVDEALLFTISGGVLVPPHQSDSDDSDTPPARRIQNPPSPGQDAPQMEK